jgi:hypothetical protein
MIHRSVKRSHLAFVILFLASFASHGGDVGYFSVGEMGVPNFMKAVGDLGAYAEQVKPGTSMLLAGGAMALSFKYPAFDLNSGVLAIGYADSKDPFSKSRYAVILTPSGAVKLKDRLKAGKTKLFVKELDGKAMLSDSIDFLNTFKKVPASPKFTTVAKGVPKNQPAIYFRSLPAKYFAKAGDSIPSMSSMLSKSPVKGILSGMPKNASGKKSAAESNMQTFLKQCDAIETRIYASKKTLLLHVTVIPTPGSKLQEALKPLKGAMSDDVLNDIVSKTIGDPSFKLTEKFKKTVGAFSDEVGRGDDAQGVLEMLPKLQFTANDSRMLISFNLPPDVLRAVLLKSGFLQEEQPDDSDDGDGDSDSM